MSVEKEAWVKMIAVRPIPLDTLALRHLTSILLRDFLAQAKQDIKAEVVSQTPQRSIRLKDIDGYQDIQVSVVAGDSEIYHEGQLFDDAEFFFTTREIVLKYNPALTPKDIVAYLTKRPQAAFQDTYKVLAHEVTHALDPGLQWNAPAPDSRAEYLNAPDEVRAHMQEVAIEAERYFEYMDAEERADQTDTELLKDALTYSRTWKDIRRVLTPQNRKKIIQGVATYLTDKKFLGEEKAFDFELP